MNQDPVYKALGVLCVIVLLCNWKTTTEKKSCLLLSSTHQDTIAVGFHIHILHEAFKNTELPSQTCSSHTRVPFVAKMYTT